MESGRRALIEGSGAALRSLAVPLAPSSGTPPIRGVPNIGRSAPSKHKTETTGMSAPVTPVWWNVLRATRTAAIARTFGIGRVVYLPACLDAAMWSYRIRINGACSPA